MRKWGYQSKTKVTRRVPLNFVSIFIQHMGHDYISHVIRYAENLILQYAIIRMNMTAIKSCTFSLVLPETTKWAKQSLWENHVNSRDPKRVFHSSS